MQISSEQYWNSRLGIFIHNDHHKMIEVDGPRGTWGVRVPCTRRCRLCSAIKRASTLTGVRKVTVDRYIAAVLFEDGTVRVFGMPHVVGNRDFVKDPFTSTKVLQLVANHNEISAVALSGDVVMTFSGQRTMTQDFILSKFSHGAELFFRGRSPIRRGVISLENIPEITLKVKCEQQLRVKDVSVGRYHLAIVTECGGVFTEQLENAIDGQADIPAEATITGVQHVSCGMKHTAYVLADGKVIMRGKAEHGRTTVPRDLPSISQAVAMEQTTVLLASDGGSAHWFGKETRTYWSRTVITDMKAMASTPGSLEHVQVFFRDADGWFAVNTHCEKVFPRFEKLKLWSTVLSIEVALETIIFRRNGDEILRIPYQDQNLGVSLEFLERALHCKGVSEVRMFKAGTFVTHFCLDEAPEMALHAILPEVLPVDQHQQGRVATFSPYQAGMGTLAPQNLYDIIPSCPAGSSAGVGDPTTTSYRVQPSGRGDIGQQRQ